MASNRQPSENSNKQNKMVIKNQKVLVSAIINCFNGDKFLNKALQSIKNQTYKNIEIILIDNHSTDKSAQVFKNFKFKQKKYKKTPFFMPLYMARNFGIRHAQGEIIAFLDSDDIWHQEKIESQVESLHKTGKEANWTNINYIREKQTCKKYLNKAQKSLSIDSLAYANYLCVSSLAVIKKKFEAAGLFDEEFTIMGDYDYALRTVYKKQGSFLDRNLTSYRLHQNNFSSKNKSIVFKEVFYLARKYLPKMRLRTSIFFLLHCIKQIIYGAIK